MVTFNWEAILTEETIKWILVQEIKEIGGFIFQSTGCILMILGKYEVTTLARKQPVSFEWCHLLPLPGPF